MADEFKFHDSKKKTINPPDGLMPPALHGAWACHDLKCKSFEGKPHYRWPAPCKHSKGEVTAFCDKCNAATEAAAVP